MIQPLKKSYNTTIYKISNLFEPSFRDNISVCRYRVRVTVFNATFNDISVI